MKTVFILNFNVFQGKYKFLRLNFANGDMCGHTGSIPATTDSVAAMYVQMKRLIDAVAAAKGAVIATADHGNCEEMLDKKGKPMTSHTTRAVPFWILDQNAKYVVDTEGIERPGLANVAATVCNMLGFQAPPQYHKSLIRYKDSTSSPEPEPSDGYAKSAAAKSGDSRSKPY